MPSGDNDNIAPLAITMGEPAGVGPEIIATVWNNRKELNLAPFLYIGAPEAIHLHNNEIDIEVISNISDFHQVSENALACLPTTLSNPIQVGVTDQANGKSVIEAIDKAVMLARSGAVSGIVTAPIHKAALYSAGFEAPGHTEYLARKCDMADSASIMMLACDALRVIPVTIHIPLKDVSKSLRTEAIVYAASTAANDLKARFGIETPRIAIAGLNPHAGEDGAMGIEEATHIQPAIWALEDMGIQVSGPHSADTLFHAEARENYDVALCMYHDQALIPIKTLDFWGGVNVTLGLPIIRTSPDHGTALEIAGQGKAHIESMVAAIRMAGNMAQAERKKA